MFLPERGSLKNKRSVTNSLTTRIKNKFNVSVTEVANQEKWQRLSLGMAMVSSEQKMIERTFTKIIQLAEVDGRSEIIEHSVEIL